MRRSRSRWSPANGPSRRLRQVQSFQYHIARFATPTSVILRIMDDLKATGSKDAEPSGIFRIGLSHALAQPSLVASIQRLTTRFDELQPVLSSHLRQQLVEGVRTGELDVALAFLSADDTP